jgi:hypothetical protein
MSSGRTEWEVPPYVMPYNVHFLHSAYLEMLFRNRCVQTHAIYILQWQWRPCLIPTQNSRQIARWTTQSRFLYWQVAVMLKLIPFLGCYTVLIWAMLPTFRRYILHPSSVPKCAKWMSFSCIYTYDLISKSNGVWGRAVVGTPEWPIRAVDLKRSAAVVTLCLVNTREHESVGCRLFLGALHSFISTGLPACRPVHLPEVSLHLRVSIYLSVYPVCLVCLSS